VQTGRRRFIGKEDAMKYTAGPWTIAAGTTYCAIRTDARVIADMRLVGLHYNKADAALIAAAPDLLEALKVARHMIVEDGTPIGWSVSRIDEVIAKATGAA
jgi:hypothetical protein